MYSDTHFHFKSLREDEEWTRASVLKKMAESGVQFALDIGTDCDDLTARQELFENTFALMESGASFDAASKNSAAACRDFVWFTAGIWPDPDSIKNRASCVQTLRQNILAARGSSDPFKKKLCALGECGLDHHWNPGGVDNRSQDDFDDAMVQGERELFMAQLELAKELDLPVIVHSRDAAEQTVECVKESGYGERCVIHCYSYGLEEAKVFLDLGCVISFSGAVTYAKKSQMEEKVALLAYVPQDRLLVETDAPYLAPVPMRGKPNNPTYIEWTYKFIAQARGMEEAALCDAVDQNARRFFRLA
ncbi:MAG: TatD family hydrolase [Treponema sp.]|nr:TatD family hydrolase [Treponema sp.]